MGENGDKGTLSLLAVKNVNTEQILYIVITFMHVFHFRSGLHTGFK